MARQTQSAYSAETGSRKLDLRNVRQQMGKSLEQIADTTKISIRFLRAIEDEDFEKLPGGIFNTSYLRQYAAAVGFEEATLLSHYNRKAMPAEEQQPRSPLARWWFKTPASAE